MAIPLPNQIYIRPRGKKASNYWRSLAIGLFYPLLTFPRNVFVLLLWPLLTTNFYFLVRAGSICVAPFHSLYVGVTGRIDVLDGGPIETAAIQLVQIEGDEDERRMLDEHLEREGKFR